MYKANVDSLQNSKLLKIYLNFMDTQSEADPGFEKGGLFLKTKWIYTSKCAKKIIPTFMGPNLSVYSMPKVIHD